MAIKDKQPKAIRTKKTPLAPPTETDFDGKQLDLFRSFLCNTDGERDQLSNTFDLWDSVPRYAVSRQQMDKLRKEKGFLSLQHLAFQYRQRPFEIRIQAARIYDEKTKTETDYYPSANEELIEDALRKIAAEQRNAFFDKPNYRSGVVFSLYMLREELKRRGHARSYQQIVLSLNILARSTIEIITKDGKEAEGFTISGYFSGLAAVSKHKLTEDPDAKWIVQFHPLVTQAMDTLTYRQFNYAQMMSHTSQLARWIHKQLSLKFTFASLANPFEMRYSTIKRDSALLNSYARERDAIAALDNAWNELKTNGVLMKFEKNEVRGLRQKLEDVVYILTPSLDFVSAMKAANKRESLAVDRTTGSDGHLKDQKKR
ncbi:MAG: replication protein [Methyloglobulus sp.]|nr:replication protein [Methyloglobulus sp.]